MTKRIMTVYGTRPEAIKVAPVIKALEAQPRPRVASPSSPGSTARCSTRSTRSSASSPTTTSTSSRHGQTLNALMVARSSTVSTRSSRPRRRTPSSSRATPRRWPRPPRGVLPPDPGRPRRGGPAQRRHPLALPGGGEPQAHLAGRPRCTSRPTATLAATTCCARASTPRRSSSPATPSSTPCCTPSRRTSPSATRLLEALEASGRPVLLVTTHRRENWGDAMEGVGRAAAPPRPSLPRVRRRAARRTATRSCARRCCPRLEGLDNVLVTEPLAYGEFTRLMAALDDRPDRLRRRPGGGARRSASPCSSCARTPSGPRPSTRAPSSSSAPTRSASSPR